MLSVDYRAEIEQLLEDEYPELALVTRNGEEMIVGSFPVKVDGECIDRFQVEIRFPPDYPVEPPVMSEVGGRVAQNSDRHNTENGACLFVRFEWKLHRKDQSLKSFLDGPVQNWFVCQLYFEEFGKWPHDARSHGRGGVYEALCENAKVGPAKGADAEKKGAAILRLLAQSTVNVNCDCPCFSGRPLRDCHGKSILELRDVFPRQEAAALQKGFETLSAVETKQQAVARARM